MSNSRIFCIGFAVCGSLNEIARMLGYEGTYTGIDGKIVSALACLAWGTAAVAILGDRTTKDQGNKR